ncbi:LysR substrate-binding domain-containing protein [Ferrimonas senticii]|uniref:LysR substrate-binding domain-containing protein n=1 Tax=Ferrimonas senticii TaxID=394566 RepID=UPI0003F59773|nr:LysR substrate-binding domain-containing protein [Ferrimonas senticii]
MRFSLKQLAVFEAIARSGSVSQAAEQLDLSQSATSMALQQLERMLGHPLFERQNKRMALTVWGNWLRPKAKKILLDVRRIESGFAEQQIISGDIAVAVSQTAAEHLFPQVLRELDQDFPAVKVAMSVRNSEQVIEGIRNYQYDLGIIEGRCDDNQIQQEIWCHDHLAIVASANHPYARSAAVSFAQLERAQWVLREQGSGIRAIFESALHGHIDDLNVWREYEHVRVIKKLVAEGLYLSCLPFLDIRESIARGELVELNVPALNMKRPLTFIWRRDALENPLRDCIKLQARRVVRSIEPKVS